MKRGLAAFASALGFAALLGASGAHAEHTWHWQGRVDSVYRAKSVIVVNDMAFRLVQVPVINGQQNPYPFQYLHKGMVVRVLVKQGSDGNNRPVATKVWTKGKKR